tara:strand:+ start:40 stop:618 length:579 start_codon:yes stop_codon:yes gene_type:complete
MKSYIIDCHDDNCKPVTIEGITHRYCNKNTLLFQSNYEFFILTYQQCLERFNHLDFKESIVRKVTHDFNPKKIKTKRFVFRDRLKNDTNRKAFLDSDINEICYYYWDASGREYGIMIEQESFKAALELGGNYANEKLETEQFIKENYEDNKELIKELEDLYFRNQMWTDSDRLQSIALEQALTQIKQQINNN